MRGKNAVARQGTERTDLKGGESLPGTRLRPEAIPAYESSAHPLSQPVFSLRDPDRSPLGDGERADGRDLLMPEIISGEGLYTVGSSCRLGLESQVEVERDIMTGRAAA